MRLDCLIPCSQLGAECGCPPGNALALEFQSWRTRRFGQQYSQRIKSKVLSFCQLWYAIVLVFFRRFEGIRLRRSIYRVSRLL